jgi:hypothetical protein
MAVTRLYRAGRTPRAAIFDRYLGCTEKIAQTAIGKMERART